MRGRLIPICTLSACLLAYAANATGDETERASDGVFTPILVSVVGEASSAVKGSDGRWHAVYELLLTNAKGVPATVQAITFLDAANGSVLSTLTGGDLVAALRTLAPRPVSDSRLAANESRLVFVSLSFPTEADVPEAVEHRIEALAAAGPGAREPSPVSYVAGRFGLRKRNAPVFRFPLEGEGWLAVNGCCEGTGVHRGALQTVNARLVNSQRFAIDWMKVDGDGRLVSGDPSTVQSWFGYGARVHAAAAGKVVSARDDLPDQLPGQLPDPNSLRLATVLGNHVVLDHGNGLFTFYAHLKPGSVVVTVGKRVEAGDVLGLLGNSGNTSAPHMHFHVMTGPSPLGSDGIPFVFDAFLLAGKTSAGAFDKALDGAGSLPPALARKREMRQSELPMDLAIVGCAAAD